MLTLNEQHTIVNNQGDDIVGLVAAWKSQLDAHPAKTHAFLLRFENEQLSRLQLRRFGIQWYKTAKAHKEAFPYLVATTVDDEVRFELVEILREEYGNGDREKIHAKLLQNFLQSLGLTLCDVDEETMLPAAVHFSRQIRSVWMGDDPIFAFGLHFALEYLAASLHSRFANGLEKYPYFDADAIEYFCYHRVAEQHHADWSEVGLLRYLSNQQNVARLHSGMELGSNLLAQLWDEFHVHVFEVS